MNLFEFDDYKEYMRSRIRALKGQGRGQQKKIAEHLAIGSVNVSQILHGDRNLTVEQAVEVTEFFGFNQLESKYFISLVEYERAGTKKLQKIIRERINSYREQSQDLKTKFPAVVQLNEESKSMFYSHWYYSGIRLLTSIPGHHTPEQIAQNFNLPLGKVQGVIDFLLRTGLCKLIDGQLSIGPSSTHVESTHPLVSRHHSNWRFKAMEKLDNIKKEELFLTVPCSLDDHAFQKIRQELVNAIEKISKTIDDAPSTRLACLNVDWFGF
ncbi:MAG: TIGR02147 family protein [Bdellovibrio sp.]